MNPSRSNIAIERMFFLLSVSLLNVNIKFGFSMNSSRRDVAFAFAPILTKPYRESNYSVFKGKILE